MKGGKRGQGGMQILDKEGWRLWAKQDGDPGGGGMGLLDEWQWGLWTMWDADTGQGEMESLDKEIEPNTGITGCVGGTQPHPHLGCRSRAGCCWNSSPPASPRLSPFPSKISSLST